MYAQLIGISGWSCLKRGAAQTGEAGAVSLQVWEKICSERGIPKWDDCGSLRSKVLVIAPGHIIAICK